MVREQVRRDVKPAAELTRRQVLLREQVDDRQPGRITERGEGPCPRLQLPH